MTDKFSDEYKSANSRTDRNKNLRWLVFLNFLYNWKIKLHLSYKIVTCVFTKFDATLADL